MGISRLGRKICKLNGINEKAEVPFFSFLSAHAGGRNALHYLNYPDLLGITYAAAENVFLLKEGSKLVLINNASTRSHSFALIYRQLSRFFSYITLYIRADVLEANITLFSFLFASYFLSREWQECRAASAQVSSEKIDINNVPLVTRVLANLFLYEYPKRHPFLPRPEDYRSRCLLTRVGVV